MLGLATHRHIALTIALTLLQRGSRHECYKQSRPSSERANDDIPFPRTIRDYPVPTMRTRLSTPWLMIFDLAY